MMPGRVNRWLAVVAIAMPAVAALAADDKAVPGLDFLEFLSVWESQDGDWLDPLLAEPSTPPGERPGDPVNSSEDK